MLLLYWQTNTPAYAGEPIEHKQQPRSFTRNINKTASANYLLYLPHSHLHDISKRWPLIIFLHGSGERGDDLSKVKEQGLPKLLETKDDFPFIVISPQIPMYENWDIDVLDALLDEALEQLPVDPDRVYITGLSLGGHATWQWAAHSPDRFAAIAPVCGAGPLARACRLSHVPIWAFHGDQDTIVPFAASESMVKAVQSCGGEAHLTAYPGVGHDAWTDTYANPELYSWFLQHRRGTLPN